MIVLCDWDRAPQGLEIGKNTPIYLRKNELKWESKSVD